MKQTSVQNLLDGNNLESTPGKHVRLLVFLSLPPKKNPIEIRLTHFPSKSAVSSLTFQRHAHIRMHAELNTYIYKYIYKLVFMYTFVCVCVVAYIYTYIFTNSSHEQDGTRCQFFNGI